MSKKRVFILAKELAISNEVLLKTLKSMAFDVKSHMSTLTPEMIKAVDEKFRGGKKKAPSVSVPEKKASVAESALKAEVVADAEEMVADVESAIPEKALETKSDESTPAKKETGLEKPAEIQVSVPDEAHEQPIAQEKIAAIDDAVTIDGKDISATKPRVVHLDSLDQKVIQDAVKHKRTVRLKSDEAKTEEKKGPPKKKKKLIRDVPGKKVQEEKKTRRKRKRRRKAVDEAEILESVRKTIAEIGGPRKTKKRKKRVREPGEEPVEVQENVLRISEFTTVAEFALQLGKKDTELIGTLMKMGLMVTRNQRLDMDTIIMVADEYGCEVVQAEDFENEKVVFEDDDNSLKRRPPVVTVMGHVDHGKTSILDYYRKSRIIDGEAGGITQHIGAYTVETPDGLICFIDTPGHEAFTSMRSRGSQLTDIVVLVVSADEGIKPQTVEAIQHARHAEVPLIVAINKIDLPTSDPEVVKRSLADQNLLVEEWGGETISVEVSAKTGEGMDKLLEMLHLQAEMMELKANPDRQANAAVIESKLDRGKGSVISILVKGGTLKQGHRFVVGCCFGKVRALLDESGNRVKEAGPSIPVRVLGCNGTPLSGDQFVVVKDEKEARKIANRRSQNLKSMVQVAGSPQVTLEGLFDRMKEQEIAEVPVVIKGDSIGSIEALSESFEKLSTSEVRVHVIYRAVGAVNESDVLLASASKALIIGYHVRPSERAKELASEENIDLQTFDIIYKAIEAMQSALEGLLEPEMLERALGVAEVLQVYHIPKVGNIAGATVKEGKIFRNSNIRVVRDGMVLGESTVSSLRRFKDDVKEVAAGFECGIGLDKFSDLQEGDKLESYAIEEMKRKLAEVDN